MPATILDSPLSETSKLIDHGEQLLDESTRSQHLEPKPTLSRFPGTSDETLIDSQERMFLSTPPFSSSPSSSMAALDEVSAHHESSAKLIIVMVGLPARGKSYVTKKLCRYLNWLQHSTMIFNVGDRRRKLGRPPFASLEVLQSEATQEEHHLNGHSATFFDPDNNEGARLREMAAMATLDELLDYLLCDGGSIAIFDATNSTIERREVIVQKVRQRAPELRIMFLESQCFDESLLESNMRLKLSGPDFKDEDPVLALEDFKKRVAMYEKKYVPLGVVEERKGYPYCQMIDVGRKFIIHNVSGFFATQAVHYLQHFNLLPRQIWLTRHGESHDDAVGRIGGDAELTPFGVRYAAALSRFIDSQRQVWKTSQEAGAGPDIRSSAAILHRTAPVDKLPKAFHVWTSMMRRSVQTAQFFSAPDYQTKKLRMLDELNAGVLEGLTRQEVKDFYSEWFDKRQRDKYRFRYPGTAGEGYQDVTNRLKSVILEVESVTDHVLLISGLAVTRILLAYFRGLHRDEIVDLHVPLSELHLLEPKPYGVDYRVYLYNAETDWFDLRK